MVLWVAAACGKEVEPLATAPPGVVFTFPADGQVDVPTGVRIVVTFSDKVDANAIGPCGLAGTGGFCLVGPGGPVDAKPAVVGDGSSVEIPSGQLAEGATYELFVGGDLAPFAKNLPASGPIVRFTTRSTRVRAAPPTVIAVNGTDPARLGEADAHPMLDISTIHLVFSEPLDPRTVAAAPGSVELVTDGTAVPATVIAEGIHVAIDPISDLRPDAMYQLRLGNRITDLGGQPLAPVSFTLVPRSTGDPAARITQVLRTRQPGDPGPAVSRAGAEPNVIQLDSPLIGHQSVTMQPSVLIGELADPKALGGPIAFTIRRGQRLRASGLDVALGGEIPVGLSTGDLQIDLLTDAVGRIFRNPFQSADQPPENARAPLYVDLSMDLAVFATDPTGNAVLSQTVLGVQASGIATPTGGVLAIEAVGAMDLGLLGVTTAPSNLVLELITSTNAMAPVDAQPPTLIATYPADGTAELPVDAGIELIFDEPVDLDRLRAGGVRLEDGGNGPVPAAIEIHGAAVVVRPLAPLLYSTNYHVVMSDVADAAGNKLAATTMLQFATPSLVASDKPAAPTGPIQAPMTVVALSPGAPCAAPAGAPLGRCAGSAPPMGAPADDPYKPFTLESDRPIEVEFSRPLLRSSAVLGTTCGSGSVRVQELSTGGTCTAPVSGTLLVHGRGLSFVPDRPWTVGARYRVVLVSGDNPACDPGELCSTDNRAASFDPLAGAKDASAGGPDLTIDFTATASTRATGATPLLAQASPWTDLNGSGYVDTGELPRDENRAALQITGTTGNVTSASFNSPDCLPGIPGVQACMYLQGALPVEMGALSHDCPLPGGGTAPACVPVAMSPQAMYATSVSIHAVVMSPGLTITVDSDTGTSVLRIREPASRPLTGYIIDGVGGPKLVAVLDLYMDAPDMTLPASTHDLHSKPLSASLEGPVSFLPDGRIAIEASNTADLPVEVKIDTPSLMLSGTVKMVVPQREMKLRLVSPPLRGGER